MNKGLALVLLALTITSIRGANFEVQAYILEQPANMGFYGSNDNYIAQLLPKAIDLGIEKIENSPTVTFVKGDLIKYSIPDSKPSSYKFVTDGYSLSIELGTVTADQVMTQVSGEFNHPQSAGVKLEDGTLTNQPSLKHLHFTSGATLALNEWMVMPFGKISIIYRVRNKA